MEDDEAESSSSSDAESDSDYEEESTTLPASPRGVAAAASASVNCESIAPRAKAAASGKAKVQPTKPKRKNSSAANIRKKKQPRIDFSIARAMVPGSIDSVLHNQQVTTVSDAEMNTFRQAHDFNPLRQKLVAVLSQGFRILPGTDSKGAGRSFSQNFKVDDDITPHHIELQAKTSFQTRPNAKRVSASHAMTNQLSVQRQTNFLIQRGPHQTTITVAPNADAKPSTYRALHLARRGPAPQPYLAQMAAGIEPIWTLKFIYSDLLGTPSVSPAETQCKHKRAGIRSCGCTPKVGGFECIDEFQLLDPVNGEPVGAMIKQSYTVRMLTEGGSSPPAGVTAPSSTVQPPRTPSRRHAAKAASPRSVSTATSPRVKRKAATPLGRMQEEKSDDRDEMPELTEDCLGGEDFSRNVHARHAPAEAEHSAEVDADVSAPAAVAPGEFDLANIKEKLLDKKTDSAAVLELLDKAILFQELQASQRKVVALASKLASIPTGAKVGPRINLDAPALFSVAPAPSPGLFSGMVSPDPALYPEKPLSEQELIFSFPVSQMPYERVPSITQPSNMGRMDSDTVMLSS
jgi:hypothetical protein